MRDAARRRKISCTLSFENVRSTKFAKVSKKIQNDGTSSSRMSVADEKMMIVLWVLLLIRLCVRA